MAVPLTARCRASMPPRHSARRVITHPPLYDGGFLGLRRRQASVTTITPKGFAPLSRAVSTVVRTSASALAAHMAR